MWYLLLQNKEPCENPWQTFFPCIKCAPSQYFSLYQIMFPINQNQSKRQEGTKIPPPPFTGNVEFWPGFYVQVQILGGQINLWGINGTPWRIITCGVNLIARNRQCIDQKTQVLSLLRSSLRKLGLSLWLPNITLWWLRFKVMAILGIHHHIFINQHGTLITWIELQVKNRANSASQHPG